MKFSKDGTKLASTSTALAYGVLDLTNGATKTKKNPHGVKYVTRAVFGPNGDIFTAGEDCLIRIWKGI